MKGREVKDKGWMSADLGVALIVMLMIVLAGANAWGDYISSRENKIIAQQSSQIGDAAKQYIKKNYNTLYDSSSGGAIKITLASLKSSGLLPEGVKEKNSFGQTYQIAVVRNKKDSTLLDAMLITSGGSALKQKSMTQISKDIKGLGGYIDNGVYATGAMGTWQMTMSDYGLASTTGHIAIALTADVLDSVNQESDRLYRYAVNGRPELNKMNTAINMGDNNINNAKQVNATDNITSTGGNLVTTGSKGWVNSTYGGGINMTDDTWVRVLNGKSFSTDGQLKGGTVRSDGRLSTGEVLQLDKVNVVGTVCSPNGLVSRDNLGAILSCQSGVWKKGGGSVDHSLCQWVAAPNAWDHGSGYKQATCPKNWVVQSLRWYQVPSYVDDEHVDAYCCPLG